VIPAAAIRSVLFFLGRRSKKIAMRLYGLLGPNGVLEWTGKPVVGRLQ
jgi:hypothetical protein